MCPACISTVALIVAGAASPAGMIVLVAKKLRAKSGVKKINPVTQFKGDHHGTSKSRIAS
jgi:hypothetical protein